MKSVIVLNKTNWAVSLVTLNGETVANPGFSRLGTKTSGTHMRKISPKAEGVSIGFVLLL